MFETTLMGLLSNIEQDMVVLPAMQRPFVWGEDRIIKLIDSILRGFPTGAVMLWSTPSVQRYRRFRRDIDDNEMEIFNFETSDGRKKYLVLDGQQRLQSLYAAFKGTLNHKSMFIDILSGSPEGKDPGDQYFDCRFLSSKEADDLNTQQAIPKRHFLLIKELIRIDPVVANTRARAKAQELQLDDEETNRVSNTYLRCASALGSRKSLQVILIEDDPFEATKIDEILEVFVRINSGGMVLFKSDLLMSLFDLTWNDIQPEIQKMVKEINENRAFNFTRDDVLKSLLLAVGSETRFDKLVSNRDKVGELAVLMPDKMSVVEDAWKILGCILTDDCKIYTERMFRGGHNSLLPFVLFLAENTQIDKNNKRKVVVGIYLALMSGIFASAEARMGSFARKNVASANEFPLEQLARLIKQNYGIDSLDKLLRQHLDLTLNIAHGGITIGSANPEELQRDHIFPKALLEKEGYNTEKINHYSNFHFLRARDNRNKSDTPPDKWFRKPGTSSPYTNLDLEERLLTWDLLEPGNFDKMLEIRSEKIKEKAETLFGMKENEFNNLFN